MELLLGIAIGLVGLVIVAITDDVIQQFIDSIMGDYFKNKSSKKSRNRVKINEEFVKNLQIPRLFSVNEQNKGNRNDLQQLV